MMVESPAVPALVGARILHTMIRVADLDRSLAFYVGVLGMRLLRREEFAAQRFTLAFVGYADETATAVLELTWNWDIDNYTAGTGFGHIAICLSDIYAAERKLAASGVPIIRTAGPLIGKPSVIIAFVQDPDGYRIELIQE